MERRLAEDLHSPLGNHVLAAQNFEKRGFTSTIRPNEQSASSGLNAHAHVTDHWGDAG